MAYKPCGYKVLVPVVCPARRGLSLLFFLAKVNRRVGQV